MSRIPTPATIAAAPADPQPLVWEVKKQLGSASQPELDDGPLPSAQQRGPADA